MNLQIMKSLFTVLVLLIFIKVNSQVTFTQSIGFKYFIGSEKIKTVNTDDSGFIYSITENNYNPYSVLFSPRINVLQFEEHSTLSVGTHAAIGIVTYTEATRNINLVIDFPIVAEYNFGVTSNPDNESSFGFYLGGGYGLHKSAVFDKLLTGPIAAGGIRFLATEDTAIDFHVSYLKGTGDFKNFNLLGIGMQYAFAY